MLTIIIMINQLVQLLKSLKILMMIPNILSLVIMTKLSICSAISSLMPSSSSMFNFRNIPFQDIQVMIKLTTINKINNIYKITLLDMVMTSQFKLVRFKMKRKSRIVNTREQFAVPILEMSSSTPL